jgi:zinc D-Ala-D-Ala dipeptidase
MNKPYQQVAIVESGEPLVAIPSDHFALELPHAYEQLGAPYGGRSPFYVRQGVLDGLIAAQRLLEELQPGWRMQVFDAYRPIAVQQFMVDHTFATLLRERGWVETTLTPDQRQVLMEQVYEFWAVPSEDPTMPPPHSTGAAVDVTLLDAQRQRIEMGSPIDEVSPRSYPDFFAEGEDEQAQAYHQRRQLLAWVMTGAGFRRHPREWWHFSLGDQFWAWLVNQDCPEVRAIARYGSV